MKLSLALCLSLCGMFLAGCSTPTPVIVQNEVPPSLLIPTPFPARPNVNTGNDTLDFKNASEYVIKLEASNEQNIAKINAIHKLINP